VFLRAIWLGIVIRINSWARKLGNESHNLITVRTNNSRTIFFRLGWAQKAEYHSMWRVKTIYCKVSLVTELCWQSPRKEIK
jgi:hypothetical protein